MRLRIKVIILLCALTCGSQRVDASPSDQGAAHTRNKLEVLKFLWPVLKSFRKVGRIYYSARCNPSADLPVPFPQVGVQPPSKNETGLSAVQTIFRNATDVKVTEDKKGIIDIRIGRSRNTLLATEIHYLHFTPLEQYNRNMAIGAIEKAPEVQAALRGLGARFPAIVYSELIVQPEEGLPHLSPSMADVTVDQALDSVAKAFGGIVLFGSCEPPRLFTIEFAAGFGFDDRALGSDDNP